MARTDRGGTLPPKTLYDPAFEHDACGVGFVADLQGRPSHALVRRGLAVLERLAHRGATGAEAATGDGAGILTQLPHRFLAAVAADVGIGLPRTGGLRGRGWCSCRPTPTTPRRPEAELANLADEEGLAVLGWRVVPVDDSTPGRDGPAGAAAHRAGLRGLARAARRIRRRSPSTGPCFVLRKRVEHASTASTSRRSRPAPSSTRGCSTAHQLRRFFPDLVRRAVRERASRSCTRASRPTPSRRWPLAHPYRYVAHNGEINTVAGQPQLDAGPRGPARRADAHPRRPRRGSSRSHARGERLGLLRRGARAAAPRRALPAARGADDDPRGLGEPQRDGPGAPRLLPLPRARSMEPWDGPAAIAFTDGTVIGAVLDRNGLRPARYWVTDDGLVVLASEVGVLDLDPATIVRKGRLQPGRMFLVDTAQGRIVDDDEIKADARRRAPLRRVAGREPASTSTTCRRGACSRPSTAQLVTHQRLFGYTDRGAAAHRRARWPAPAPSRSARWAPTPPIAGALGPVRGCSSTTSPSSSRRSRTRRSTRSARSSSPRSRRPIGPERQPARARPGVVPPDHPARSRSSTTTTSPSSCTSTSTARRPGSRPSPIDGLFRCVAGERPAAEAGGRRWPRRSTTSAPRSSAAIEDGANIIVLSDRNSTAELAPIPSLLLVAAVHHHLVRERRPAPGSGSSSRPATPARCTTWRSSSATARPRSTRTSRSRSIVDMIADGRARRASRRARPVQQLHQGRRQGRA